MQDFARFPGLIQREISIQIVRCVSNVFVMYEMLLITLGWQFIMFMGGVIHQGHVNMDVGGSAYGTPSALAIDYV